jgi:hypothetical protein
VGRAPVHESWTIAVHEALAGLGAVLVAQLVPGDDGCELVLTTGQSPPPGDLVEELRRALGPLLSRDDSPLGTDEDGAVGWHFYPPLDERDRRLFARLDWQRAVVLHEFVD